MYQIVDTFSGWTLGTSRTYTEAKRLRRELETQAKALSDLGGSVPPRYEIRRGGSR